MEISSLWPYETALVSTELEPEAPGPPMVAPAPTPAAAADLRAGDRIELVTAQNVGSLPVEPLELEEALRLVQQVRARLHLMDHEEQQGLYHFDRLRALCCRLQQAP